MTEVILVPLAPDDREQFIKDNQGAFNYGALCQDPDIPESVQQDLLVIQSKAKQIKITK